MTVGRLKKRVVRHLERQATDMSGEEVSRLLAEARRSGSANAKELLAHVVAAGPLILSSL